MASVATKAHTLTTKVRPMTNQTLLTPLPILTLQETPPQPATLTQENTSTVFSSVPTTTLLSSLLNLSLMSFSPAVDIGSAVVRSGVLEKEGILKRAILAGLKRSVYGHFCAGEDQVEASETLEGLWEMGLSGILDYGLEDAEGNGACDGNLREFLKTVDLTSTLPPNSVSFACVKITAICPITLLERVSDHLRWEQQNHRSNPLPWKLPSLPVLTSTSPLYHTTTPPPPLTDAEQRDLHLAQSRLTTLAHRCAEINLPLLVDAEYTSVQPAIDHMTYSAMLEFNKKGERDQPLVYGTVQAYLKDSMERLGLASEAAGRVGVELGVKLVRGAYMSRESKVAQELGGVSPIHGSIGETHECYNKCAEFMLEKVAQGSGSLVLATHNVQSGKMAATKSEEMGIGKEDKRLQFAQLKGMADGLSLGLKNAGFNVSKYLAFGPVEMVIPYLLRRAEENRGVLAASTFDRQLMKDELKRRFKAAVVRT